MTGEVSPARRREVIDALRRGTVPHAGLDLFAVGMDRFTAAVDEQLGTVAARGSGFQAVRGEYGSGKTFFARWLAERAKRAGLAASEIQISETEPAWIDASPSNPRPAIHAVPVSSRLTGNAVPDGPPDSEPFHGSRAPTEHPARVLIGNLARPGGAVSDTLPPFVAASAGQLDG